MRKVVYLLALIYISFQFSNAIRLSLTVFSNRDYLGESVTFQNTRYSTLCANELIGNITSYCYVGLWQYISDYAYTFGPIAVSTCGHFINSGIDARDIIRMGPADTSTPAIVLAAGYIIHNFTIIEKLAEANIYVVLTSVDRASITTYGHSSWTLFEDTSFEGRYVCFGSSNMITWTRPAALNLTRVGSVIRGCDFSSEYINQLRNETLQ